VIDIAPGYVVTDLNRQSLLEGPLSAYLEQRIPRGKPGTVGEISSFVATLFVSGAQFLTGETIYIDGGQSNAH
jgi:NAD(P)-dependent dehydrogenase (short-subunit alcohol dehydrogenase family)